MGLSVVAACLKAPPPDTDVFGALLGIAQRYAAKGLTVFREVTTGPVTSKKQAQQQVLQRGDYVKVVTVLIDWMKQSKVYGSAAQQAPA